MTLSYENQCRLADIESINNIPCPVCGSSSVIFNDDEINETYYQDDTFTRSESFTCDDCGCEITATDEYKFTGKRTILVNGINREEQEIMRFDRFCDPRNWAVLVDDGFAYNYERTIGDVTITVFFGGNDGCWKWSADNKASSASTHYDEIGMTHNQAMLECYNELMSKGWI